MDLSRLIDQPQITIDELCHYVKGPDFPTGGIIHGYQGIFDAYKTGRGHIQLRARVFIEKEKRSEKERIIVTEIPRIRSIKPDSLKKLRNWSEKRKSRALQIYATNQIVTACGL